jgi:putative transposase
LYYKPQATSPEDLELMRILDEEHLEHPFLGSRKLTHFLCGAGWVINRKHVQRLMRVMGLEALVPKPATSDPTKEHPKYPYLLRNIKVGKVNQVWASDITYVPMRFGFMYLVVVMDWFSRRALTWRLSNSMESGFCVDVLEEALRLYGHPEIFNTDQGSQFTAEDFTRPLRDRKIAISMDGKGRWRDNVFVERLWRSLKHEEVYLHAYEDGEEARAGIGRYLKYYNEERPHQAL